MFHIDEDEYQEVACPYCNDVGHCEHFFAVLNPVDKTCDGGAVYELFDKYNPYKSEWDDIGNLEDELSDEYYRKFDEGCMDASKEMKLAEIDASYVSKDYFWSDQIRVSTESLQKYLESLTFDTLPKIEKFIQSK